MYGDDSINVSSDAGPVVLREVKRKLITGTAAAATMETTEKVDALIRDNHRNTSELCTTTGFGKSAVIAVIEKHGYRKACAR